MSNQLPRYLQRLEGIRASLMSEHMITAGAPSASKGKDRELFVRDYLSEVFPAIFRFGSGFIIDSASGSSGQIDIVMENPYLPSLPAKSHKSDRLYFSEGVTAAIEVKSNLSAQLQEAVSTANSVASLDRQSLGCSGVCLPAEQIACVAVGYQGCKEIATASEWLASHPSLDAILIIEHSIFVSKKMIGKHFGYVICEDEQVVGPGALWAFMKYLCRCSGNFAVPQDMLQYYPNS